MIKIKASGELGSLVKTNLASMRNMNFGGKKGKFGMFDKILLLIILIASTDFSVITLFHSLHSSHNEILIFNGIINIQLVVTAILIVTKILNTFYLASDWREMTVYPIKTGNLLLSKYILSYFSSMIISTYMIILLFSYGVLSNASIFYYVHVLVYEIVITAVPGLYIALISLNILWLVAVIKKSKKRYKSSKWFLVVDLAVIVLTYMLLKNSIVNNVKIGSLLFSDFFSGSIMQIVVKFIMASAVIIIACIGFYLTGGNVYMTIMESGMFNSKDFKETEIDPGNYEFKLRKPFISNIIRDAKLIIRTPSIRFNCITLNFICSIIGLILLIVFRKQFADYGTSMTNMKSLVVIGWFFFFSLMNATHVTSFSREGRWLTQFRVFPFSNKRFLISKFFIGLLSDIGAFIVTSVMVVIISSDFTQFMLLEITAIVYIIGMSIIYTGMDLQSLDLKWIDIKDLFKSGHNMSMLMPTIGIPYMTIGFIVLVKLAFHIKLTEYLTAAFVIFLVIVYAAFSFKKLVKNMKCL